MIALIPLRGGSKGIPKKNIKEIAGKPLCQWVIEAALESQMFDRIIASTECEQIADTVRKWNGDNVEIDDRPPELATDKTSTEAVMKYMLKEDFETMCLIQATGPLTVANDFRAARAKFNSWGCDSLLTVKKIEHFFWMPAYPDYEFIVRPLNYHPENRPRRQDGIRPVYQETGNFYFTKRWVIEKLGSILGGIIGRYIIDSERAVDIDTLEDFRQAEGLLEGKYGKSA